MLSLKNMQQQQQQQQQLLALLTSLTRFGQGQGARGQAQSGPMITEIIRKGSIHAAPPCRTDAQLTNDKGAQFLAGARTCNLELISISPGRVLRLVAADTHKQRI